MTDLLGSWTLDAGAMDQASDFFERSRNALGISSELNGRGVGQDAAVALRWYDLSKPRPVRL